MTRPHHHTIARASRGGLGLVALASVSALFFGCAEGRSIAEPANTCGDGRPRGDEECDDGADNSDERKNACRTDCTLPHCGDGVKDTGEACDDGNEEDGDGCDAACKESYTCGDDVCDEELKESCSVCADDCCPCGDGVCTVGEQCGVCPGDCCPACGNGALDAGEACDDGNNAADDGCGVGCNDEDGVPTCGNGYLELGEVCDDENTTGRDGCGPDCRLEYVCGDTVCENDVGENCETCLSDCCPNCGDAVVNDFEECDGAVAQDSDTCADLCYAGGSPTCQPNCLLDYSTCEGELPVCGNGVIECGEVCDADDVDGLTCEDLGRDGGSLRCSEACEIDASGCGDVLFYFDSDFDEGCPDDWTLAYPWQCGVPTAGPGSASSPPNVLSTSLAGDYPANQSYSAATATSPVFNLSLATSPVLSFRIWHDLESGYDAVQVLTSTDGFTFVPSFTVTPAYGPDQGWTGESGGWQTYSASLANLAGQEQVQVRFGLVSDGSGSGDGAFIDDVVVGEACGNGVIDSGEVCDGDALGSAVCPEGTCGTPRCADDCSGIVDGVGCVVPECGNGEIECDEQCDEADLGGQTCDDLGYDGGDLGCSSSCEYDFDDCGALLDLLPLQTFETCPPAGWTLAGIWECGVPTSGPNSAYAGTRVIATNVDGDHDDGHRYDTDYAQTPPFLVQGDSPILSFYMWLRSESSFDGLRLEVSTNGSTWTRLDDVSPAYTDPDVGSSPAWDDTLTTWAPYLADLSAYDGQTVRVRFAFYSDGSNVFPGAYIDNVRALPNADTIPVVLGAPPVLGDVYTSNEVSVTVPEVSVGVVEWLITERDNADWIDIDQDTGEISGQPTAADAGPFSFTVRARRAGSPGNFDEVTLSGDVIDLAYGQRFDQCPAGFTFTGDWSCGDPSSGPADAFSPPNCVGTNGYSSSLEWGESVATSPVIDLTDTTDPQLSFRIWSDTEEAYDRSRLEISVNGGAFTVFSAVTPAYTTASQSGQVGWADITSWTLVTADLGAYAGDEIQLRWSFWSDGSVEPAGTFFDDILITRD